MSKARPAGHLTAANRMVPARPARSHLNGLRNSRLLEGAIKDFGVDIGIYECISRETVIDCQVCTHFISKSSAQAIVE